MKKVYDIIYSLGTDCSCAIYLTKCFLRSSSGPFDWLTHASFETRAQLIVNGFEGFLDKDQLVLLPKDENISNDAHCDYYHHLKTDFYHYHDFRAGVPLEEQLAGVQEKYNRRIERFYESLKAADSSLLVYFSHYSQTSDETLIDWHKRICEKLGKSVDMLIVEHDESMPLGKKKISHPHPCITRYHLYTMKLDKQGNPTTTGREKDCLSVLKPYRLRYPLGERIKRAILRPLLALVPMKKLRRRLRKEHLSGKNYVIDR